MNYCARLHLADASNLPYDGRRFVRRDEYDYYHRLRRHVRPQPKFTLVNIADLVASSNINI